MKKSGVNWDEILERPVHIPKISGVYDAKEENHLVEDAGLGLVTKSGFGSFVSPSGSFFGEWIVSVPPMLAPQSSMPEYYMDNFEKVRLVEQGISKNSFENFKAMAGLDYNQLATLLSAARNTLINKKGDETFSFDISERLVALAEVYTHGLSVFEDWDKWKAWLQKPNRALRGVVPFDLLHSHYGRVQVHNILGRIEWGVYS